MDGPSGLNQPRRKSRLRSREGDFVRRAPATLSDAAEMEAAFGDVPLAEPIDDPRLATDPASAEDGTAIDTTALLPGEAGPLETDAASEESDELPEAFRLNKVYEDPPPVARPLTDWRWWVSLLVLSAAGVAGGYWFGEHLIVSPGVSPRNLYLQGVRTGVGAIDAKVQADLDAAFDATKHGRYDEARQRFAALRDKHPEWPSMAVEIARDTLYQHDSETAQKVLGVLSVNRLTPDADFMLALLHLTNKEFDVAETGFAATVALEPSRPEYYYFWGECLRRDGKPQEAIEKFRSALLRNQYENAEGLFQLKLWLSEIQADKEEATGGGKEIDAALAQPRPSYAALFAAAGRAIKVHKFDDAAAFIAKAQDVTEPTVFRVILQDPTFLEEATRPVLAPFFQ